MENVVLGVMHQFFTSQGFHADALIFDGVLVKDDSIINAKLLNECERFIREKLRIDLRLARKPMEYEVDFGKEIAVDLSNVVVDNDQEHRRKFIYR